MKLAIQAWYLNQPHTGIGVHTEGLLNALGKEKCQVIVALPSKQKLPKPLKALHIPVKSWLPKPLQKIYWEYVQVPDAFEDLKVDWELFTYPTPLPRSSNHLRASTVHDTILWNDKRYHSHGPKGWFKRLYHRASKRALAHADQLFTVSKYTQKHLGLPAEILPNATPETKAEKSPTKTSHTLVYLGGYDIRKRVPELLKAFSKLRKEHPNLQLHCVGQPHHKSKIYPSLPKTEGVKFLKNLSHQQVRKTLTNALAFIHFSDAEGFNIPLLQAMEAGVPAVVPDLEVNKEISQNTALFFKPSKFSSLSKVFKKVLDPAQRKTIVQAQKKAARSYTWAKSAKMLLQTLRAHESMPVSRTKKR